YPSRRVFCTEPKRFAEKGDTLVSVRAPVGALNIASESCALGRGVAALRHRSLSRVFTYGLLSALRVQLERFNSEGTVFGAVNKKALGGLRHVEPPRAVVRAFELVAEPLERRLEMAEQESHSLAQIRDELLPRLLSGELPVSGARRIVEGAA